MDKKNNWFIILRNSPFLFLYLNILLYIFKVIVVNIHIPGAQGGTGGW